MKLTKQTDRAKSRTDIMEGTNNANHRNVIRTHLFVMFDCSSEIWGLRESPKPYTSEPQLSDVFYFLEPRIQLNIFVLSAPLSEHVVFAGEPLGFHTSQNTKREACRIMIGIGLVASFSIYVAG